MSAVARQPVVGGTGTRSKRLSPRSPRLERAGPIPEPHRRGIDALLDLAEPRHVVMVWWLLRRLERRERVSVRAMTGELHIRQQVASRFLRGLWRQWAVDVVKAGNTLQDRHVTAGQTHAGVAGRVRETLGKHHQAARIVGEC